MEEQTVFENGVLRRILGQIGDELTGVKESYVMWNVMTRSLLPDAV
jgi:hypothetical protein